MVEHQPRSAEPGAGPAQGPAPAPASAFRQRKRVIDLPANDNTASLPHRITRAAVFVVIGGILAWLLRTLFG